MNARYQVQPSPYFQALGSFPDGNHTQLMLSGVVQGFVRKPSEAEDGRGFIPSPLAWAHRG